MNAEQAIALAVDWILQRGLDHPTKGLAADRFEAGWRVYAPVDVDESDPLAFLDMPVGRSVFLVGDSGRVTETSTSIPPRRAHEEFIFRGPDDFYRTSSRKPQSSLLLRPSASARRISSPSTTPAPK